MLVIEMRILSIKVLMKIYKNIEYNQEHSCFPVFFFTILSRRNHNYISNRFWIQFPDHKFQENHSWIIIIVKKWQNKNLFRKSTSKSNGVTEEHTYGQRGS